MTPEGSVVIELGNAWNHGIPTMSTLPIESLLEFKKKGNFHLCQEFICFNPARLPSPVEWVNKKRIRVKDAFTRLWWLSKTNNPKADNRRVLVGYSQRMLQLFVRKEYNSGKRPSGHNIGKESFLRDNGGAIPSNVIVATNTIARDGYLDYCRQYGLAFHPARMSVDVPAFFIKFLSDEDDWIMDPFAGSNMTGFVAEKLKRNWISIEASETYALGSVGRFVAEGFSIKRSDSEQGNGNHK